jgi:hypothetical protein
VETLAGRVYVKMIHIVTFINWDWSVLHTIGLPEQLLAENVIVTTSFKFLQILLEDNLFVKANRVETVKAAERSNARHAAQIYRQGPLCNMAQKLHAVIILTM